ncbi:MAG: IclR family transcriptional regulator [Thermodesulfobacteriota bacterium]|nr:IclR family transcriptional regulator [Thermodesulfobacteriota bacterium]
MSKKYQAPSVKKAFQILKNISDANRGLGVSELSKDLGISKSTVHGITSVLEELGVVIRDPLTKRYKLGFTLFELGRLAYSNVDLRALARPAMEDLMKATDSSVFLGVLSSDHVTILDIVESGHNIKITSPIGTKIPVLAGATGKVFMACLPEEQAMKIILSKGLTKYTDNTILNPGRYFQEIRDVRRKGYATDDEEYILGVRAVAAPIQGNGSILSAIWVVGFKASLDGDKMKAVIEDTLQAAATISRRIHERAVVQE